jgi:hypothetical protein
VGAQYCAEGSVLGGSGFASPASMRAMVFRAAFHDHREIAEAFAQRVDHRPGMRRVADACDEARGGCR